jgi:1,6-anhydro-N-acetylmuramate kinase
MAARGGAGVWGAVRGFGAAASRTMAASCVIVLTGRHSSNPSCHTNVSSFTAPAETFVRSSDSRIGPTGTPLIAAYHSSVTLASKLAAGAITVWSSSSSRTFF